MATAHRFLAFILLALTTGNCNDVNEMTIGSRERRVLTLWHSPPRGAGPAGWRGGIHHPEEPARQDGMGWHGEGPDS